MTADLIFGGDSDERLVSVASAQNVVANFPWRKLFFLDSSSQLFEVSAQELLDQKNPFEMPFVPSTQPVPFDVWLKASERQSDILFLALHGGDQENGRFQSMLQDRGIRFTGSDAWASKLCFDKVKSKNKLVDHLKGFDNAKVAASITLTPQQLQGSKQNLCDWLKTKALVFKPNQSGSSVGLYFVHSEAELETVLPQVLQNNLEYLVEEKLNGREITVGVIEDTQRMLRPLPPSEVLLQKGRAFDYQGKYLGLGSQEITPASLTLEQTSRCQALALKAHEAMGCYGYSRTDMILTDDGVYFLEINTLPGLTKASFIPQQLAVQNISMTEFVETQLILASKR